MLFADADLAQLPRHFAETGRRRRLPVLRYLEVHEQLGSEPFEPVDLGPERHAGVLLGPPDEGDVFEVLGTDPGDDAAGDALQLVGRRVAPHRQLHLAVFDLGREEVHRRRPDEARHEDVAGVEVEDLGRGDLLEHTSTQHRDAVPSVIASVWSCVT